MDLTKQPVSCFTGDMDWANEEMIGFALRVFSGVPFTPFITHESDIINREYANRRNCVGLHPNFRPGSTQGRGYVEVTDYVITLWEEAKCFRSHSFYDSYQISSLFFKHGFKYDSNLCLHLQPSLVPLRHATGLLRYPVFLQDNHYMLQGGEWDVSTIDDVLDSPGLKIFNFHPVHIALNTPDMGYYEKIKLKIDSNNWKDHVYPGEGTRTFLVDLIETVQNRPGGGIYYLDDLHNILAGKTVKQTYDESEILGKTSLIKDRYNSLDGTRKYSTSRDYNLRELEIDFILKHVPNGSRILDIGCGNGYTDIRIAQERVVEIIGIDFSEEMINGAEHLKKELGENLVGNVVFNLQDVTEMKFRTNHFDVVISERCLLNLPNRETQFKTIQNIHRVLKDRGTFLMVEGTRDGLRRLNDLRSKVGLDPIPDRAQDNVTSLKFDENDLELFLTQYFRIFEKQYFGTYYLISRVVHPLLVAPKNPRFDARINDIAREVANYGLDHGNLGHIVAYVLKKI